MSSDTRCAVTSVFAQIPFVLAVLVEQRFHLRDFLPELVDFAQRELVVVGHLGEEGEPLRRDRIRGTWCGIGADADRED